MQPPQRFKRSSTVLSTAPNQQTVLAIFKGATITETWELLQQNRLLPLSFGRDDEAEDERTTIRAAVGLPVMWDVSSLYVAEGLGVAEQFRVVFQGSRITHAALQDAADGIGRFYGSAESEQLSWDPTSERPVRIEAGDDVVGRRSEINERMLPFAHRLTDEPDFDPTQDDEMSRALSESRSTGTGAGMIGAVAAAKRLQIPLYHTTVRSERWPGAWASNIRHARRSGRASRIRRYL